MNIFLAFVIAVTVMSTPTLAQSVGEKSGINSALGVAPKTSDFVKEVAVSDMFEIESSKLAQTKGNAETKTFAQQMVTDHTKTSTELKSAVAGQSALALPTALDNAHQKTLDKLNGLSGADFDKEYRSQQVKAHQDAVSLFKRYSSGGDDAKLKEWATRTLPALQHHLEMAQALDANRADTGSRALTPGETRPDTPAARTTPRR